MLIKENHIAAAGGVAAVMRQALALKADVDIQIEVESLDQLQQALGAGATSVLLDNFALDDVTKAVRLTGGRALLEVSGGVTLAAGDINGDGNVDAGDLSALGDTTIADIVGPVILFRASSGNWQDATMSMA